MPTRRRSASLIKGHRIDGCQGETCRGSISLTAPHLCHTGEQAVEAWRRLGEWLAPRGLSFNEDKTRVVHLEDGFDFLGCNIRRYDGNLLIKPSAAAVNRTRQRISTEVRSLHGSNAEAVVRRLNSIVRGWSSYYRSVVAKKCSPLWIIICRRAPTGGCCAPHPNKSKRWVRAHYFGPFNPSRRDRWVFGGRDSGTYLRRFAWTRIVRQLMVAGTASTDDAALNQYRAQRRRRTLTLTGGHVALRSCSNAAAVRSANPPAARRSRAIEPGRWESGPRRSPSRSPEARSCSELEEHTIRPSVR